MKDKILEYLEQVKDGSLTSNAAADFIIDLYAQKDITYDMVIDHLKTNGTQDQYGHVRVLDDEYDETFIIPVFLHDSVPGIVCIGGDKGEHYEFDELIVLEIIS